MQSGAVLWCQQCGARTHHVPVGRYDTWGHLTAVCDRCLRCGAETTPAQGDRHELPAADPPPVTAALTAMEIARCGFIRNLVARGMIGVG